MRPDRGDPALGAAQAAVWHDGAGRLKHGRPLDWESRRLHDSCVHAPSAHGRGGGAPPDGPAALLAARAHPDVIRLNFELPDIPRGEMLRRLPREWDTTRPPVVVVSGKPDAADHARRHRATGTVTILHTAGGGAERRTVVDLVLEARREVVEEATRRILATHPAVEILMVSLSEDEDAVANAVKDGAQGYLLQTAGPDELFDALRRLLDGEAPRSGDVAGRAAGVRAPDRSAASPTVL